MRALMTALVIIGLVTGTANARTVFDDIRDTAQRTVFDEIRYGSAHSLRQASGERAAIGQRDRRQDIIFKRGHEGAVHRSRVTAGQDERCPDPTGRDKSFNRNETSIAVSPATRDRQSKISCSRSVT